MKEAASSAKRLWNDLEKSVLDRVNLHMLMIGKTPNSPHLTALFQGLVMERLRLRLRGKPATAPRLTSLLTNAERNRRDRHARMLLLAD